MKIARKEFSELRTMATRIWIFNLRTTLEDPQNLEKLKWQMYFTHFTHLPISHAHAHPHQCVPREILMHFDVLNMLIRTTPTLLRLFLYFDRKGLVFINGTLRGWSSGEGGSIYIEGSLRGVQNISRFPSFLPYCQWGGFKIYQGFPEGGAKYIEVHFKFDHPTTAVSKKTVP